MERRGSHTQGQHNAAPAAHTPSERPRLTVVTSGGGEPHSPSVYHNPNALRPVRPAQSTPAEAVASGYRRRRRRKVTARFYRMVALAAVVLVGCSYAVALWRVFQVDRQITAARRQIVAAQKRNDQLREALERVSSDDYIEEAARQDLGLVKPGETAYIVVKPESPNNPFRVERRTQSRELYDGEGW